MSLKNIHPSSLSLLQKDSFDRMVHYELDLLRNESTHVVQTFQLYQGVLQRISQFQEPPDRELFHRVFHHLNKSTAQANKFSKYFTKLLNFGLKTHQIDAVFDSAPFYPSEDEDEVRFLLFTRSNPRRPQILHPGDPGGAARTQFDPHSPTKAIFELKNN